MKKLVVFDLDGTLLDTIADLATATNYALEQNGFPARSLDEYPFFVGNGIDKLFERALPEGEKTRDNIQLIRQAFISYYDEHNADRTAPYPGIPELLAALQEKGCQLAVASNKYQQATEKLIGRYFPGIRFAAVFGQREGVPVKPDPSVVNEILQLTGVARPDALYVGDSGVDMQTAANSGVDSIGVSWGFRSRQELEANGAGRIVDRAAEILPLID